MAAFEYVALDAKGKEKKGVMEGDTAKQVRAALREQGMAPMSVEPATGGGKASAKGKDKGGVAVSSSGVSRISLSTSELSLVTRQIATLVRSGIPIEESLKAVSEQTEKPKVKSMLLSVRARVVEGHTLADGLMDFPKVFDHLFCAMVAAGEKSGHLEEVLDRLADYTESSQAMKTKIQMAMIYPAILTFMAVAVVSGLLTFVVPKVVEQFADMGAELPLMTRVMIGLSDFLTSYGIFLLAAIVGAVFMAKRALKEPALRKRWHGFLLTAPVIGKVIRGLNTARFARTLSILSASGVPLLEGLRIAGDVLSNDALKETVAEATTRVREGSSLRSALGQTKHFPPMMLHMIGSGENSGELEQMLRRAADNQDREFENLVTVTLGMFEPLMILTMGLLVMMIVMAILLPIFQMNTMAGG